MGGEHAFFAVVVAKGERGQSEGGGLFGDQLELDAQAIGLLLVWRDLGVSGDVFFSQVTGDLSQLILDDLLGSFEVAVARDIDQKIKGFVGDGGLFGGEVELREGSLEAEDPDQFDIAGFSGECFDRDLDGCSFDLLGACGTFLFAFEVHVVAHDRACKAFFGASSTKETDLVFGLKGL